MRFYILMIKTALNKKIIYNLLNWESLSKLTISRCENKISCWNKSYTQTKLRKLYHGLFTSRYVSWLFCGMSGRIWPLPSPEIIKCDRLLGLTFQRHTVHELWSTSRSSWWNYGWYTRCLKLCVRPMGLTENEFHFWTPPAYGRNMLCETPWQKGFVYLYRSNKFGGRLSHSWIHLSYCNVIDFTRVIPK